MDFCSSPVNGRIEVCDPCFDTCETYDASIKLMKTVKYTQLAALQVLECQVVIDPRTRESYGFAFVTMETVEDAERCIKYLNPSVLEGCLIIVEKVLNEYPKRSTLPKLARSWKGL